MKEDKYPWIMLVIENSLFKEDVFTWMMLTCVKLAREREREDMFKRMMLAGRDNMKEKSWICLH
jgi:hypothetical protein